MPSTDIDRQICFLPFPKSFKKARYDLLAYTPRNIRDRNSAFRNPHSAKYTDPHQMHSVCNLYLWCVVDCVFVDGLSRLFMPNIISIENKLRYFDLSVSYCCLSHYKFVCVRVLESCFRYALRFAVRVKMADEVYTVNGPENVVGMSANQVLSSVA